MNRTKFILAAVGAAALTLGMSACSTPGGPKGTEAAPTENIGAPATDLPSLTVECVDGSATISEYNADISLKGTCDDVKITGSNSLITLGEVKSVVVEGSINLVTAKSIDKLVLNADGNVIKTDNHPLIEDNGNQNLINASQ